MTNYVVGFAFDGPAHERVVLIRKNRPSWQAGKLNGVGGHIEPTDMTGAGAMAREFKEETGVETTRFEWRQFATVQTKESSVQMFAAVLDKERFYAVKTATDEKVIVAYIEDLDVYDRAARRVERFYDAHDTSFSIGPCLPNLRWLIPLATRAADLIFPAWIYENATYEKTA